jgi:hypothetical protein
MTDKFWIIVPYDDMDIRYDSRQEAEKAIINLGGDGYILKTVAYCTRPEIQDIR